MRKRITSLLLALVMLLSLAPTLGGTARAAEEDRIEVHTYQQLQDALEQPGFNEIVLMEDIDAGELTLEYNNTTVGVQEPIVIGANSFPWLDLNGHTLRLDTVFKLSHYIKVSGSSQLTIDDNSPGKTGKIIGHLSERYFVDEPSAGVILVSGPEAVLDVVGGTIAGENCPAVHVRLGVAQIRGDAKIQRIQDRKPFDGESRVNKWPQKPALVVRAAGNNVPTVRIGPLPDVDANPQILGDVILDAEKIWEYGFGYDGKLWKESFLIITGGTFHGEVFSNFRTVSGSYDLIFEDIPALRIEGGTFHGKVTTCEWTCEGWLKGQEGYVQSYPAIKLLGGTFYDDVYLQKENRALRAKHLDNYRVKTALAHTVDNSMVVKEDGAYVGLNIWEGFDDWTLEPWSRTYPIMFKATREAPLTVIPNAWGVPKIKLDNDPVQYAKDWRGEVLELENNRQHTLVFQWDELPQAMKDEGYTYDVKLDIRRPDGTMASHSGNHLLVNQFVVTLPKGTKPGFYGYDLHLNLKKDGKLLGFVSNENIVRLKLKYAPEPDPALTGSVFHPSAIVYGRPISTAITGLPDGLSSDDLSYQWQWLNNSNDWKNIEGADQASYTPGEADLRRFIRVTATAPGYLGQLAGASLKVSKAVCSDYPELKLTPTVNTGGQLTGFQVLDFDSDTYEYVYTTTLPAGGTWPTDGTPIIENYGRVSGLTPGSTYYVTVRYKETETHLAGSWVRTEKVTLAPNLPLDRFELEGYRARGFGNDTIYLELGDSMDLTVTASPFYASAWNDTTFGPAYGSESLFTVEGPTLTSVPGQIFPEKGVGIVLTGQQVGTGELQAKYIDAGREMNYGSWKVVVYDDPQDIGVKDARFDLDPAAFSDVTMYDGRTLNAPDPDVTVYPEGAEGAYQYKWYVGKPYAGIGGAGTEYVTDNGYLAVDPHTGKVTAKQAHGADVDPAYKTVALFAEKDGSREKLASYQVTVEGAPTVALTGVILSPEQVRLKSGDTFQLTAAKIPADAPVSPRWTPTDW